MPRPRRRSSTGLRVADDGGVADDASPRRDDATRDPRGSCRVPRDIRVLRLSQAALSALGDGRCLHELRGRHQAPRVSASSRAAASETQSMPTIPPMKKLTVPPGAPPDMIPTAQAMPATIDAICKPRSLRPE